MLFSVELPALFNCVRVFGYLGALEKSRKNILKISAPEASTKPKWGHRAARGAPGALLAPPLVAPGGALGWSHTPWCPTSPPIFTLREETPKQKSLLRSTSRSRCHPLFFLGRANLVLFWPPVRANHRHRPFNIPS